MAVKVSCLVLVLLPVVAHCARNSWCTTPNNEQAKCIPVTDCTVIVDALKTNDNTAIAFAQKSQCGYDSSPLVCCGSWGTYKKSGPLPEDCGTTKDPRIIGGEVTKLGEHPWAVLLRYKNNDGTDAGFQCGGSLISKRYVLTAAHCVLISSNLGFELDSVRLGEWKISTDEDCDTSLVVPDCSDPVVDVGIEEKIPNNRYERRTGKHDIALLRLKKEVQFSDWIRPICVPGINDPLPPVGARLTVVGWGTTENNTQSDDQLKVDVPLVSLSSCQQRLRNQRRAVTEDQLCAGGDTNKDSCRGDSGGPLMYSDQKNQPTWRQEGVVSWGVGCGITGYPAVYTRVSKYRQWIEDNLKG